MADITMPQLGETVTEGTITKWFKQVGDQIAEDEVLFEVSTDKVDSEVPSPVGGYLTEILVAEGETVDVGTKLAIIGDAPGDGGGGGGDAQASPADDAQDTDAGEEPKAEEPKSEEPKGEEIKGEDAEAEEAKGEDSGGKADAKAQAKGDDAAGADGAAKGDGSANGGGKLLSPVVRRLVAEHGLDPNTITGTGAGGRITRGDVLAVIEQGGGGVAGSSPAPAAPAAEPAPAAAPTSAPAKAQATAPAPAAKREVPRPAPITPAPGERDTAVPHTNIRRRTAEHMIRSKQTSAHVYASIEVDYEAVEVVRRTNRDTWRAEEGFGLTYLPFIARAVVDAIREYPEVNASFGESELVVHHDVNLGIAVDLDFKGLIVPVVRGADGKRLRAIAREVSDLAARARGKKLGVDDIEGGTFTITNPGPFGTTMTLPIINQPQVAILSTDGVKRRPVVVDLPGGAEAIAIHSVGNLTLTWDHRAFDGAYAAAFLARIKDLVETRDWAAEL